MKYLQKSQSGSVAVYIVLMISFLILSSALVLSGVLSVQLRLTRDVVSTEQAFYAANSGVEQALYTLVQNNLAGQTGDISINDGEVMYDDGSKATYGVNAKSVTVGYNTVACISSLGEYAGSQRRLNLGPSSTCSQ